MVDASGRWFIDGLDIYVHYNMLMNDGTADFLKFPRRKDTQEHDWKNAHGTEVDTSRHFLDKRQGNITFTIFASSKTVLFEKRDAFLSHMIVPGTRRLQFASHGERSYYCIYKECTNIKSIRSLTGEYEGMVTYQFDIVFEEPEPAVNASHVFIIDEQGRFLIT